MKIPLKKSILLIIASLLSMLSSASSLFAAPLSVTMTPSSDQIILKDESISFSCAPAGGCTPYTYSWSFQNATPSSSTGQSANAVFGASAEGNENTVTITVTDHNGDTASANITVKVLKIETQTVAATPSDRTRKIIGIGEEVNCSIRPASVGSAIWSGGAFTSPTGTSTTFNASKSPSTPTIKATVGGKDCTVALTVVAPSGLTVSFSSDGSPGTAGPPNNNIAALSVFDFTITPTTVSFYNIELRENIPGETWTWPDGTSGARASAIVNYTVGQDNKGADTVGDSLKPISRINNGSSYVNFNYIVRVPEEYKNQSGVWMSWLSTETHPRDFRGSDQKSKVSLVGSNTAQGGWMGPWQ